MLLDIGLSEYRCLVFFFKQKTAYEMRISDWSSDVCSSDLADRDAILAMRCEFRDVIDDAIVERDRAVIDQLVNEQRTDRLRGREQTDRRKIGRASCRERVLQYV